MISWFRRALPFFFLFLGTFFLAGCWSRHEIEDLAIISAVALDAAPGDRVRLSVYVIIPRAVAGGPSMGGGGGGEPARAGEVISTTGSDFIQAARRLEEMVPRRLLWSQNRVLILGEELAGRGLSYLDFFTRGRQMRLTTPVLITRGEGRKVLELPPGVELTTGTILTGILRNRTTFKIELKDLLVMWEAPGDNPVLPQVVMTPTPELESKEVKSGGDTGGQEGSQKGGEEKKPPEAVAIRGAGAFRDDRLAGWLDEEEAKGLIWLRGEVEEGVITVELPARGGDKDDGQASVIFHRAGTQVKPMIEGNRLIFNVEIGGKCELAEALMNLDPDRPEDLLAIQEAVNRAVEERVLAAVRKAQQELQADIFGLGEVLHRSKPRYWHQVQEHWNEEFSRAQIQVKINLQLTRLGMTNRTSGKSREAGGKGASQGSTR
ncbi:Ger(x)C family spore germination protein [Moorella sulfitireducens]|uniref:Ger(x)C family spore germination protein n=1 Tax=Neomoorella sulfitireducens TaxID=2972948 RepID=UPI0021AC8C83|nr:Ger(x)C family spore germination protein [Moorella sulfitireducens]